MTREEINKFLANTKVYVNGKSKEIQEKLFSLGYKWHGGCTDVKHTESPFLFIYADMSFSMSCNINIFSSHKNREILAEGFLSLELTEPTYRPFKDIEECWNEMLKHQPFGWVKTKDSGSLILIGNIYLNIDEEVYIVRSYNGTVYSAPDAFNNFTFADGTPFGIKED